MWPTGDRWPALALCEPVPDRILQSEIVAVPRFRAVGDSNLGSCSGFGRQERQPFPIEIPGSVGNYHRWWFH